MSARILDGARIAREIQDEAAAEIRQLAEGGVRPGLAVVLAGDDAASQIYVRNKVNACEALGLHSQTHLLSHASTTELLALVERLNADDAVDGILVQLPLPAGVDAGKVLLAIDPAKDVDGFHPLNVGALVTGRPGLTPCTPSGIIEILKRSGIAMAGAEAVIVGRSVIVGKPVAMLLLAENATVTICHSRTHDLAGVCRRADILVAAVGKPGLITPEFVKPGATVIDVGINRVSDPELFRRFFAGDAKREATFAKRGSVVMGDVDPKVAEVAGALTPVPGGVGPLTIAMLVKNTVKACRMRRRVPAEQPQPAAERA